MKLIDKNKINKALDLLESKSTTSKEMDNKLKRKLLKEEEEDIESLDLPEEDEENEEDLPEKEEEIIDDEDLSDDEEEEFIDITGGVEEKDGVFTITSTPEVTLSPGNKIKFLVGDEEFKGTIGEPLDEEGTTLSIELSEEVPEEVSDEDIESLVSDTDEENFEDDDVEDSEEDSIQEGKTYKDQKNFYGKKGSKEDDELDENYLSQHNQEYSYGDLTEDEIIDEVILEDEEEPLDNNFEDGKDLDSLDDDFNDNLEDEDSLDGNLNSGIGLEDRDGISMSDNEDSLDNDELNTPAVEEEPYSSEDVEDDLIAKLLGEEEENILDEALAEKINSEVIDEDDDNEEVIEEEVKKIASQYKNVATKAEKSTPLPTKNITSKIGEVKKTNTTKSFKPSTVTKQADIQSRKLKTESPAQTIVQSKTIKASPSNITSKVGNSVDSHIDSKDSFNSKVKSKALVNLAEDLVRTQSENKKLRLENYKLLKVNGLLTLLPELEQKTRVQLVEKFDRCKNPSQISDLYTKITSVVKESRKPSLNQIVERKGDIKYFSRERDHDTQLLKEKVQSLQKEDRIVLSEAQIRKNTLMGIESENEDGYFKPY